MLNDDTLTEIAQSMAGQYELPDSKTVHIPALVEAAEAVAANAEAADAIIGKYSKTRKVERIAKVCVAIMRVALFEMDCDEAVPDKVAVNEAIELCKKYADKADCAFVSGLLGNYYRDKNGFDKSGGEDMGEINE